MNAETGEVILIRVYDKRETNLKSTQMEKKAMHDVSIHTVKGPGI